MDKLNFFNSIGHYVLLYMLLFQSKYFVKYLKKIRTREVKKLSNAELNEKIAREIFISNLEIR